MNEKTRQQLPGRPVFCIIIILLMLIAPSVSADMPEGVDVTNPAVPVSPEPECQDLMANATIPFVANEGQLDGQVRYSADTFYGTGYITGTGITHWIRGADNTTLVLTEEFLDSADRPIPLHPAGEEQAGTQVSYFLGNDSAQWRTGLSTWNVIDLGEVYPGITVKLRAHGGTIEKILYVSPGARPETVRIRVRGADRMHINREGELIILTALAGNVSMTRPVAFQQGGNRRDEVESRYVLAGNTYWYTVGEYDTARLLVIDPALDYSTYLGGNGYDRGRGIAVDGSGNAYITGYTWSDNFPTTAGSFNTSRSGGYDFYVTKLNARGALVYSTYLGGSGYEFVNGDGIAVDRRGNAYVTGRTVSTDFPTTPGAYQTTHGDGYYDVFITKLNPTGTALAYSTYLGGSNIDYGEDIAVDGGGNAYVTGGTASRDFPITTGAFQTGISSGGSDAFITKLNPTGTALVYSTYLGGNNNDYGEGIAVDGGGNAYVTGATVSTDFPITTGAFQTGIFSERSDVFITKLNPTGTALAYSTYLGGSLDDFGEGIAVDGSGNAYINGYTYSSDFPTTAGAYQTTHSDGFYDVFITKLNPTGTALAYSTYLGGSRDDYGEGIAVDGSGNAYVTGRTLSTDFPTTAGAYQTSHGGNYDVFITKLNAAGSSLAYSTYLGGSRDDYGYGIAVDGSGNAYVTGHTWSDNFPTTPGVFQAARVGEDDSFIVRSPLRPLPAVSGISPPDGGTTGGTAVTITGTEFTGATSVLFGTAAGSSLAVVNDTTIRIVSPAHAAGSVDVTITTTIGTSPVVAEDQFTYLPLPIVRFTGTPVTGPAPHTVTFTDVSDVVAGTMWNWSFGDSTWDNGTVSTNPVHTFGSAGTYTVSLTVTNATGSNTQTRAAYITVTALPTPADSQQDNGETLSDFPQSSTNPLMTVTVNIGGDTKAWQAIVTGTRLSDLIVTGTEQHGSVTGCDPPAGIVFQYLGLEPARYGTITNAVINFTVLGSWLEENHIAPGSVVLYHMTPDCWQPLQTTYLSTKDGTAYFSGQAGEFSLFAISGTPAAPAALQEAVTATRAPAEVTQAPAPAGTASEPVATRTTAPPAPPQAPAASSPFPLAPVLAIAGCIVLISGGWYARRWWIRRQNPALFEEYD